MIPNFRKISFLLRPTLVSAIIFTIILTIIGTAIPAYYNEKKSIEVIWSHLASDISQKAMERIIRYFSVAPPTAHLIEGLIERGEIDPNNPKQIFNVCYLALLANKDLTALFFVQPNGTFSGIIEDFEDQPFLASYRVAHPDGTTESQNFKPSEKGNSWVPIDTKGDDYDPRKRPYWPSAVAQPNGGWSNPYPFLDSTERGFSYSLGQKRGAVDRVLDPQFPN